MATVAQHFWGADPGLRDDEVRAALAVAIMDLPSRPLPVEEALLQIVEGSSREARAALLCLGREHGAGTDVLGALAERRAAGLSNDEGSALDAIAIARATRWPEGLLSRRLVRPRELLHDLAQELAHRS